MLRIIMSTLASTALHLVALSQLLFSFLSGVQLEAGEPCQSPHHYSHQSFWNGVHVCNTLSTRSELNADLNPER